MAMTQSEFKSHKAAIRAFLRTAYPDERLAMLLAHAQDGKLSYWSCCCLVGITTCDHALHGRHLPSANEIDKVIVARHKFAGAREAEDAFLALGEYASVAGDVKRRRILIPMILAEQKGRSRAEAARQRKQAALEQNVAAAQMVQELEWSRKGDPVTGRSRQ